LFDPYRKFRHALMLKTVNCGNVITVIAVMVQRVYVMLSFCTFALRFLQRYESLIC